MTPIPKSDAWHSAALYHIKRYLNSATCAEHLVTVVLLLHYYRMNFKLSDGDFSQRLQTIQKQLEQKTQVLNYIKRKADARNHTTEMRS